jgi:hypothetical protein
VDKLPCGCTGSRSVLHMTLHNPLAYVIGGVVVGVALLVMGKGDGPDAALLGLFGANAVWLFARVVR